MGLAFDGMPVREVYPFFIMDNFSPQGLTEERLATSSRRGKPPGAYQLKGEPQVHI